MVRITSEARREVRERLLQAAAMHFAHRGFDRANVNTIAVEAGFAKGTIYNYFASKEELFGEVLEAACLKTVRRYADARQGSSVREKLEALVAADVDVLREDEPFMKVLVREAMSFRPETYPIVIESLQPFLELAVEILAEGVASGDVRRDRPVDQLGLLLLGTITMLYVQHWGSGGAWPVLEEIPSLAVSAFLDGAGSLPHPRSDAS